MLGLWLVLKNTFISGNHKFQHRKENIFSKGVAGAKLHYLQSHCSLAKLVRACEKRKMWQDLGDWPQTSLAQGKSRKIWIVVSGLLHLGHCSLIFRQEKAKYCLVGIQLRMAFQRNGWIFLGHCNFHIQFHNCLSRGTCFCWYIIFEAELA